MLEQSALLIRPWSVAGPGGERLPGPARTILDAETGNRLGFACRRPSRRSALLAWLARPAVDVYETDDASLLFSLYAPKWFVGGWEVHDADGHSVGSLRGSAVFDRLGRMLTTVQRLPDGDLLRFLTPSGYPAASLAWSPEGSRLTFSPELAPDPFAKMLLVAAALAMTDRHRAEAGSARH